MTEILVTLETTVSDLPDVEIFHIEAETVEDALRELMALSGEAIRILMGKNGSCKGSVELNGEPVEEPLRSTTVLIEDDELSVKPFLPVWAEPVVLSKEGAALVRKSLENPLGRPAVRPTPES